MMVDRGVLPPPCRRVAMVLLILSMPDGSVLGQQSPSLRTIRLPAQATTASVALRTLVDGDRLEAGRVVAVIADAEGSVYVGDHLRKQVVVFDSTGRLIRTIGRNGQGPGEFRGITDLAWLGDTLVVADRIQRRITLLSRDGRYLGAWPIGTEISGVQRLIGGGPALAAAVSVREGEVIGGEKGRPLRAPVRRYYEFSATGEGTRISDLQDATPEPRGSDCERGGTIEILAPPFADRGSLAAGRPGGDFALARRDQFRIDFIDRTTGAPTASLQRPYPELRVSDAEWAREAGRFLSLGAIQCNPPYERPVLKPVIRAMTSDERGRLWLEVTTAGGFALDIVDPATATVVEAAMPPRDPRVNLYARNDRLYIVGLDADDVQSVMVLRLLTSQTGRF